MKILIVRFSKTGHTVKLANRIGEELGRRGHSVVYETIQPMVEYHWFREASKDFIRWPAISFGIFSKAWFRRYLRSYRQIEEDIQPLRYPDISGFDRICIGGPKWTQISFPIARYLKTVKGLENKSIGAFTTFCGPPLKTFEIDLIFIPMERIAREAGAEVTARVSVSSGYHPLPAMIYLFRVISYLRFFRSLKKFGIESHYAEAGIHKFCEDIISAVPAKRAIDNIGNKTAA